MTGEGPAGFDATRAVVVTLQGGLGNQMFQAAAGMHLARKRGAPLGFDLSAYRKTRLRAFALGNLPTGAVPLVVEAPGKERGAIRRLFDRLRGRGHALATEATLRWTGPEYRQPGFGYDPAFEALSAPVRLGGFFQSARFFDGSLDAIRAAFDFRPVVSAEARARIAAIAADPDAVSIHVRRGDYASDARTKAIHGLLDAAYYAPAIAAIRARVAAPRFYLFSDEPAEAAALLAPLADCDIVDTGAQEADLAAMAACRHHILANSSFSWWGSTLGAEEGITVAPAGWFADEALQRDAGDLYRPDWLCV